MNEFIFFEIYVWIDLKYNYKYICFKYIYMYVCMKVCKIKYVELVFFVCKLYYIIVIDKLII